MAVPLAHSTQWPVVIVPVCTGMLAPASEDAPVPPFAVPRIEPAVNCELEFEVKNGALAGTAAPFTCATVVTQLPALVVASPVNAGSAAHGRPVAFVSVTALGVPKFGATSAGLVASTTDPLPVVVAATGWLLTLLPSTTADAGTAPPLS